MTEEEKNTELRKHKSLTYDEWFTFFFFPFKNHSSLDKLTGHDTFNEIEEQRFQTFGFDTKLKEAKQARIHGKLFYVFLFIVIVLILNY